MTAFLLYGLAYGKKKGTINYNYNNYNFYLITWFFLAALVMGLRGLTVGVDTANYYSKFLDISSSSWSAIFRNTHYFKYNGLEMGYVCFAKICSIFVDDYIFFQFVLANIYCFTMMTFFKKTVKFKIILTTVFLGSGLYLLAFNINRQMIAVALTALSWNCLCNGKKFKALILLLLSATFHTSSFVFLIAYFFYIIRKRKILFKISVLFLIIASINYKYVINLISHNIVVYGNYYENARTKQTIGMSIIIFSIIMLLAIYILLGRGKFSVIEKVYALFATIYVICNIIGLYFNYFERIGVYFLPFVAVEMDTVAQKIKSKGLNKLFVLGVSVSYAIYFMISTTTTQYKYVFFWDK